MIPLRYGRQVILSQIGGAGQQKLQAARVLVVGAGGLGCPVLQYLTIAGIGFLGIADGDKVQVMNLNRQVLYDESDVGLDKVTVCKRKLSALNPGIHIDTHPFIDNKNATEIISQYDVIVDCTDNFPARYLLNDACVICKKPWVHASVYQFDISLSVFGYTDQHGRMGPTYRCLFPLPPRQGEVQNCTEGGILGAVTGLAGSLQGLEVLKIIAGFGKVLAGELLLFNGLTGASHRMRIKLNPDHLRIREPGNYDRGCLVK